MFTTVPAIPVLIFVVWVISAPDGLNFILHPLGLAFLAIGLLLAALPIRLSIYTFSLRETSPKSMKVWAAVQCAVPGSVVFVIILIAFESGLTSKLLILGAFFGSYFAAFLILIVQIVRDMRVTRESTQPVQTNAKNLPLAGNSLPPRTPPGPAPQG